MATKVKTAFYGEFRMPGICAACGGTHIAGHKKVEMMKQTGYKHYRTLKLDFPLCATCLELTSRKFGKTASFIRLGGLALGLGVFLLGGLAYKNFGGGFGLGLVLFIISLIAAKIVSKAVDFNKNERIQLRLVKKAVKIVQFNAPGLLSKEGSIFFRFENSDFAAQFSQLNLGQIS